MNSEPSFKMSQDYEVIPPKKKRAYPILVEEWEHLKTRIAAIRDDANMYHTIGSVLLGISGSALVAALTLDMPAPPGVKIHFAILVSWFICLSCLLCGVMSLYFGNKQREVQRTTTADVIQQMSLIERRYEVEKV